MKNDAMIQEGRVVLVLGGARSGKSRHAESMVEDLAAAGPVIYVATADPAHSGDDAEMAARISQHRARRPGHWQTREEPLALAALLDREAGQVVLVDCLTLWLSNLMLAARDPEAETGHLLAALARRRAPVVLVSNELGMGIVPETPLGREFRDAAGRLNQRVAAAAHGVELVVAGLPLTLKG